MTVEYTGHASKGGLQRHSIGAEYPYLIEGFQIGADAPVRWRVLDSRTGLRGKPHATYKGAEIALHSLKLRNMMHS